MTDTENIEPGDTITVYRSAGALSYVNSWTPGTYRTGTFHKRSSYDEVEFPDGHYWGLGGTEVKIVSRTSNQGRAHGPRDQGVRPMTRDELVHRVAVALENRGESAGLLWGALDLAPETYAALAEAVVAAIGDDSTDPLTGIPWIRLAIGRAERQWEAHPPVDTGDMADLGEDDFEDDR